MNEEPFEPDPQQEEKAERIAYLVSRFIHNELTDEDRDELDNWISESDDNVLLFEQMTDEKNLARMMAVIIGVDPAKAEERVTQKLAERTRKYKQKRVRAKMLAFGSVVIIFGSIIMTLLFTRIHENKPSVVQSFPVSNDVAPGVNRATLILANGKQLVLDSARLGTIAPDIIKTDSGKIFYSENASAIPANDAFNTLIVPQGGQYQVTLPDGSRVWLNAVSSLKYPVHFSGKDRVVELTGEGYFEIAKDPSKPFHVKAGNADIMVLGTHFNINCYENEPEIKTTLLEGSLKVALQNRTELLRPGEQASWINNGSINVAKDISTEDIVAWKSGLFSFHKEDIRSLMRQVARWYNVEVKFNGVVQTHFNATVERSVPLSKLLEILEGTEDVHFKIENRIIIVNP